MENNQVLMLVLGLVLISALMFLPQWQAKRRKQKQMANLQVGDEVMTIGGIIGKMTYYNADENRARIEVSPGVEIHVVLGAISRTLTSHDA
jgi:preprotein translocase subunit YajC